MPVFVPYIIQDDEIQQSTALRWLADFLNFTPEVMVPFTPRLIPAILPNLAHHVSMIQSAAVRTNKLLVSVIQSLPPPPEAPSRADKVNSGRLPASPTPTTSASTSRQSTMNSREVSSPEPPSESPTTHTSAPGTRSRGSTLELNLARPQLAQDLSPPSPSRPHSPASVASQPGQILSTSILEEADPFDYQATVNELTIQFLSEFEETRVAALKWLIMLHQKAPKKENNLVSGPSPRLTTL